MKRPEGFGSAADRRPGEKPATASGAERAARSRKAPAPASASTPRPLEKKPTEKTGGDRRVPRPAPDARRAERIRRRYERAEVRRFARRARRRRLGWFVTFGLLGTLIGFIVIAVFSPILALRTIQIDGTVRLDPAVLAEAVDGQEGVPLALLDADRIRRELGEFPLIRSYVTEIVPPDTLLIHVVERAPIGAVATAGGFDVVDPAGIVLESATTRPVGVPLLQLGEDGMDGPGFRSIAEVLLALPPEVLAQVDSITARTRDDVTFALAGTQQRIVWGSATESILKARVFATLLAHFAAAGPGEYDVSAPGSPVFRLD
jgi:cell division protein FtsQ